ncbi:MAG: TonB-dependent receptor domain-containing protein [Bacteroidales bacterium]
MKRLAAIAGLTFFSLSVFTQSLGLISGIVTDGSTEQPLSGVLVRLNDGKNTITTDQNGYFAFEDLPEGNHLFGFSCAGYSEQSMTVSLAAGGTAGVTMVMLPAVIDLEGITVEESRIIPDMISELPYILVKISRDQIYETSVRDVGDLLRSSLNISGIRKGGANIDPVVRGFKSSQLNINLNQGVKVEGGCPNRMDPATAHIEPEDIRAVEVIKGPYSLRYGPAMGAVVHVQTFDIDDGNVPFIRINAMKGYETNWNGHREYLSVAAGNRTGFLNFSGSRKDYGNYKDGYGNQVFSSFMKTNFRGQVGIRPWKHHLMQFTAEDLKGRDVRFPSLPMDERSDDTKLFSLNYQIRPVTGFFEFLTLHAYRSDVLHEMDNKERPVSDTVVAITIVDALNRGARFEGGINMGKRKIIAGFDLEDIHKDGDRTKYFIRQPGLSVHVETIWNNARITNAGFFVQFTADFGSLDMVASARIDLNQATSDEVVVKNPMQAEIYRYSTDSISSGYANFSISAGATQKLSESLSVSFAMGRGTRSPDMTERFIVLLPIGYDRFDYLGDPKLKPETNNQVDLTLKFLKSQWGAFQLNGFFSLVTDYITGKRVPPAVQKPLTAGVLGVKQFCNAGTALLHGFEFSYTTSPLKHLGVDLNAALTRGTLKEAFQYVLNDAGQIVDDRLIDHDPLTEIPPFEATMGVYYKYFHNRLIPRINLRSVAKQNHVSEAQYEPTTPGFFLAGVSVQYKHNTHLNITAGVNNLFNKGYFEHLNRAIIGQIGNLTEPGRSFYINLFFKI